MAIWNDWKGHSREKDANIQLTSQNRMPGIGCMIGTAQVFLVMEYEKIPENDRKLFDLKIEAVKYELMGDTYVVDLGINQVEVDYPDHNSFWFSSRIIDQGDLSTYYGYETLNAAQYTIKQAKVYPKTSQSIDEAKALNFKELLRQGYGYLRLASIPTTEVNSSLPLHLIGPNYEVPKLFLQPGLNPTFFLEKEGKLAYAVINGFLLYLNEASPSLPNAMIYK